MALIAVRPCFHEGIYYKKGEPYRGKGEPCRHFVDTEAKEGDAKTEEAKRPPAVKKKKAATKKKEEVPF